MVAGRRGHPSRGRALRLCLPERRNARGHGGLSISAKVKGKQLDQAYEYINWWLDGWPAAFVARQGYYHSIPENAKKYWSPQSGIIGTKASRQRRTCRIHLVPSS